MGPGSRHRRTSDDPCAPAWRTGPGRGARTVGAGGAPDTPTPGAPPPGRPVPTLHAAVPAAVPATGGGRCSRPEQGHRPVVRGGRPAADGRAATPQRAPGLWGHRPEPGHRGGGCGVRTPATDGRSREPTAGTGTVGPGGCDDAPEGRQRAALRRYLGAHRPARGVRSAPARRTQFDRADGRHAWPGALPSGGPPCLIRGSGPTAPRAQQAGGSPPLTRPPAATPTVSAGGSTVPRGCVPGCGGGPGPVPWWRGPYAVRCRGPS